MIILVLGLRQSIEKYSTKRENALNRLLYASEKQYALPAIISVSVGSWFIVPYRLGCKIPTMGDRMRY